MGNKVWVKLFIIAALSFLILVIYEAGLVAKEGGFVVGQVLTRETGQPVAGAKITIFMTGTAYDPTGDYGTQSGLTDELGLFTVTYPWANVEDNINIMGGSSKLSILTTRIMVRIEPPDSTPSEFEVEACAFTRFKTSKEVSGGGGGGLFGIGAAFKQPSKEEIDWGFNPRFFIAPITVGQDGTLRTQSFDEMFRFENVSTGLETEIGKGTIVSFSYKAPAMFPVDMLAIRPVVIAVPADEKAKIVIFDAVDNGKAGDASKGDGIYTAHMKLKKYSQGQWSFVLALVHESNLLVNDGAFAPGAVISQSSMSFFSPHTFVTGPGTGFTGITLDPKVSEKAYGAGLKLLFAQPFMIGQPLVPAPAIDTEQPPAQVQG